MLFFPRRRLAGSVRLGFPFSFPFRHSRGYIFGHIRSPKSLSGTMTTISRNIHLMLKIQGFKRKKTLVTLAVTKVH